LPKVAKRGQRRRVAVVAGSAGYGAVATIVGCAARTVIVIDAPLGTRRRCDGRTAPLLTRRVSRIDDRGVPAAKMCHANAVGTGVCPLA